MEIFSTREIAIGFWLCTFIVVVLWQDSVRGMVPALLKHAFAKRLIPIYGALFTYIILITMTLSELGFWALNHLKSTIIWAVLVALVSLFHLPSKAQDFAFFKQVIADDLKLIVIIEFIISSYTFALWLELLLVPTATFITLVAEISKGKSEFKIVYTLFTNLMTALGSLILIYAFYRLFGDIKTFATTKTLSEFLLPPILTFCLLHFLYCLAVYVIYDSLFSVLKIFIPDKTIRRYAQFKSLVRFRNNVKLLRRWQRDIAMSKPRTIRAVDKSINDVFLRNAREKDPIDIPIEQGWSPYRAKDFLAEQGLTTDEYHRTLPELDDWYACSNYYELSNGILPNNIAYYIDGDADAAKQLKLVININENEQLTNASTTFVELACVLCDKVLGVKLPLELRTAISSNSDASDTIGGKPVSVVYQDFGGEFNRFTVYFTIGKYIPRAHLTNVESFLTDV